MASLFSMSAAVAALILSATSPASAAATYSNTTTTHGNGTYHVSPFQANSAAIEIAFCGVANGHVVTAGGDDRAYVVFCAELCIGAEFIPAHLPSNYTKRAYEDPQSLATCLEVCDEYAADGCVAASYDRATFSCAYYSSYTGKMTDEPNFDFGVVTSLEDTTVAAGDTYASVVYETTTSTVLSCAATVTNCPLRAVVTDYVAVTTTVCPATAATSVPATPIACDCAYTASAVAVLSPTTYISNGATSTSYVTVSTATVNVPLVENYATTSTISSSGSVITSTVKSASTTAASASATSTLEAFTGGAAQKAGFGAAAVLAGAAMIL